ncbi:MAG TPA: hypothetical protein VGK58_16895 [Lacipirellulaceae bacterium]
MQPIAADDVAAILAEVTVDKPLNSTIDIAGPQKIRMDDLVRKFLTANRDPRRVTTDRSYFGTPVANECLMPGRNPAPARPASDNG